MSIETFNVGDKVTLTTMRGNPQTLLTVTKASSRTITLSDGSKWHPTGLRPYGSGGNSFYNGPYIRERRDDDASRVERIKLVRMLRDVEWGKLPTATLTKVQDILEGNRT